MKNLIIFNLLAFFSLSSFAQFTDDFTDGDFTSNPAWTGNASKFEVNVSNQLWLNAPAVTDDAYLSTSTSSFGNASWEFYVKMDFQPSTSNFARIYLTSDQSDLSNSLNGYYVQIGGVSGALDDVSLYRQNGTTSTKIIDGVDGTAANNPDMKVRVTKTAAGLWELFIDVGVTGTFTSQGTVTDNTIISSSALGVYCKYTSTRSDKFFFDDFDVQGTTIQDLIPPVLDSVKVNSSHSLTVYFNEPVDKVTSEMSANYSLTTGTSIVTAVRDNVDSSIVNLTFGAAFQNGVVDTLFVNNVTDTIGNAAINEFEPFIYYTHTVAQPRDIIINEMMVKPSANSILPNVEYVELFNNSGNAINLKGWTLSDRTGPSTLFNDYYLLDQSYVIVCKTSDSVDLAPFTDKIIAVGSWGALNSGDDSVTIANELGDPVDIVEYTDDWYRNDVKKDDGGWSLERIDPTLFCTDANNWRASVDAAGGTPGSPNSILFSSSDTTPPLVSSWEVTNSTNVIIYFNEVMDSASLANGTYSLNGGINVINITVPDAFPQSVNLKVTPNLDAPTTYQLSVSNIDDCPGNTIIDTTFRIASGVRPEPYDIIINEIFPDPDDEITSLPNAEFVELYNRTNKAIQLEGLTFQDPTESDDLPFKILFPGDFVVLTEDEDVPLFSVYTSEIIGLSKWPSLNNTGDNIQLLDGNNLINEVVYTKDWYNDDDKDDGGWTIELINPNDPCAGIENWAASTANIGGTPGDTNSVFSPSNYQLISFVSVSIVSDSAIHLNFDRTIDPSSVANALFTISPSLPIQSVTALDIAEKAVRISFNDSIQRGIVYTVSVDSLYDCLGNKINASSHDFILAASNDLVINEVLFNPFEGSSDFVEIHNNTDASIDLANWALMSINTSNDTSYKVLTEEHIVLSPNGFAVFTEDTSNIVLDYPDAVTENIYHTDLPSYSNSSGRVTLVSSDLEIIDDFSYNEDMHFELIDDVKGVSLERIDYFRPTNDATNWHSASNQVNFATPGYENSQFTNAGSSKDEITITPETFSPDNDGHEDVVNIVYNFSVEGYTATIKIYDANGREVRQLENNYLLGKEGVISWDGITDNNEKASIGIYIIFIEVFDLKGDTKQFKETCVLATQL